MRKKDLAQFPGFRPGIDLELGFFQLPVTDCLITFVKIAWFPTEVLLIFTCNMASGYLY
jgi:hypothetical protein